MDKALKTLLNSLKCPVCEGQIDIFTGSFLAPKIKFNYACAQDNEHYSIIIRDEYYGTSRINEELVSIYDGNHRYIIHQSHDIVDMTAINIFEIDAEHNVKNPNPKTFKFKKLLFNFSKTNHEKLVNRIKTILVFQ